MTSPIRTLSGALLVAAVVSGCQSSPSARATTGSGAPAAARPAAPAKLSLDYVEVTTAGAARDAALPLVIALHGLGDRPEHFLGLFSDFPVAARVIAPHSATPFGDGFQWFAPYGATSDESAPGMAKAADDIARFAAEAARAHPTLGKPIVTGFSQGGALSYTVAARHADAIAASVPISGWLPPPLWPASLPQNAPPIFAFHGNADTRVPLDRDKSGADALQKLGYRVELKVSDGVEHVIPPAVREAVVAVLASACDEQRRAGR
ncbi:MAG TPA: alpha/beta fold hydrolase [Polyangiaceae bacterium]|nr:alpha/beta fold hydrolase [Polyangiaceae bacterium]